MENRKETFGILFRIIILLICFFLAGFAFLKQYYFSALMLLFFSILMLVEAYFFIQRYFSKIDKVINSMLYNDFAVDFQFDPSNQTLNNTIKLYHQLKENEVQRISERLLYDQILNGLDSGLLILKMESGKVQIMLMNGYFQRYFGVPAIKDWQLMKNYLGEFYQLLEDREFSEFKTSLDIQVDKGERQTFVMQTSLTQIKGQMYYTVLIDSIQRVIYSKENEAWVSVMKVISHELMNSLAPIHALAQNLDAILQQTDWNQEDLDDMKISIGTIINRSNHLRDFVDRYRKLTMLPSPQLERVNLDQLLQSMLVNYQYLLTDQQIEVNLTIEKHIQANIDQSQIEQVLINLFTNSIHALKESEHKQIQVEVYASNARIFIEFMDSGPLIDEEIISKIFLPFYTTRKDGAGIGLSLSKAIIEAHQGYLYYQVKADKNCFVIVLMDNG